MYSFANLKKNPLIEEYLKFLNSFRNAYYLQTAIFYGVRCPLGFLQL